MPNKKIITPSAEEPRNGGTLAPHFVRFRWDTSLWGRAFRSGNNSENVFFAGPRPLPPPPPQQLQYVLLYSGRRHGHSIVRTHTSLGVLKNGSISGMIAAADTQKPDPTALANPETTEHASCVIRAAPGTSGRVSFSALNTVASDSCRIREGGQAGGQKQGHAVDAWTQHHPVQ